MPPMDGWTKQWDCRQNLQEGVTFRRWIEGVDPPPSTWGSQEAAPIILSGGLADELDGLQGFDSFDGAEPGGVEENKTKPIMTKKTAGAAGAAADVGAAISSKGGGGGRRRKFQSPAVGKAGGVAKAAKTAKTGASRGASRGATGARGRAAGAAGTSSEDQKDNTENSYVSSTGGWISRQSSSSSSTSSSSSSSSAGVGVAGDDSDTYDPYGDDAGGSMDLSPGEDLPLRIFPFTNWYMFMYRD